MIIVRISWGGSSGGDMSKKASGSSVFGEAAIGGGAGSGGPCVAPGEGGSLSSLTGHVPTSGGGEAASGGLVSWIAADGPAGPSGSVASSASDIVGTGAS